MPSATFAFGINWTSESTPDFADSGEIVTTRVQNSDGVTMVRGRDTIRALAPPAAGSCDFRLNNASKDYSPENASSPLYGKLIPGVPVRVTTTAPSATNIWRGYLDDLPQMPMLRGGFVRVPCLGTLSKLKGVKISSSVYTNYRTDQAFFKICGLAGLASSEYTSLDLGKTRLTVWWCEEDDAFDMLCRILAAEGPGAAIYEDGAGVVTFHSRHYRLLTTRCTTSQVTFGNGTTEPKHSPPFGYQPNLKGVVNSASIQVKTATLPGSASDIATWTGSLVVPGSGYASIWFDLSAPATEFAVSAIVTTPEDVVITTTIYDGEGSAVSPTGTRVEVRISGEPTTVTSLTLAAKVYTITTETVRNEVDASASIAKYGTRTLPTNYSPWPYISAVTARSFCNAIVAAYQEPCATVDVMVNNGHATRLTHMLAREISDRVTVQEDQTGMNADVMIERIRHEVKEGGRFHTTTFSCEKIPPGYGDWYVVGTSLVGTGKAGF